MITPISTPARDPAIEPLPRPAHVRIVPRQAVLLVGSTKPRGTSSSEALGGVLLDCLARHGVPGIVAHVHTTVADPRRGLDVLEGCDLLVLATPLYFDALPGSVVAVLERIVAHRATRAAPMALAALVNCGTPDAHQADAALAMCGIAACEARLAWRGGLAFGQGEAIRGAHPLRLGTEPHLLPLELAAAALARGAPIPDAARALAAEPAMPEQRYAMVGNAGWLVRARRNGALLRIAARPMTS